MVINDTYLIGLIAILINGVVTGLAVYIGSHTGQRIIDKINQKKPVIEPEEQRLIDNIIKEKELSK